MPRRGVNIYKRKDGRWEGRIKKESLGSNTRKYISVYGRTYAEVKGKMENVKSSQQMRRMPDKCTLGEVINIWLKEKRPYWKKTTYATYCHMADKYIIPKLGSVRVSRVNESVMEKFLGEIRYDEKGSALSNRYLRNICGVILRAMNYVKRKYHYEMEIPENLIMPSKQKQIILPSERELAVLEKYLLKNAGDDTCLGILIAFYTGLRIGELCALTWEDINLEEEIIYVRRNLQRVKTNDGQKNSTEILNQTPKTCTSLRIIPIPPVLLSLLKTYREDEGYIVKGRKKPFAEPRTLQYRFEKILKVCCIANFNFHMLRHAFATRCIAKGFDVKSLSEILGHSSIQITLNLYVHSNMQRKKQLMEKFNIYLYQSYS